MPQNYSTEVSVIAHYADGKLVAVTHFNGHAELLKVEPMTRKDHLEFYENKHQSN
jgi:hypothetical protein